MQNWRVEFDQDCNNILKESYSDAECSVLNVPLFVEKMQSRYSDLHELHVQGWIQKVVKESFSSFAKDLKVDIDF